MVEQIIENNRRIGGAGVIVSYGGMPHDVARANIRLFAEKVMPRLQAHARAATNALSAA